MRAFYREHEDEILVRMRNPTSPTQNTAAELVAKCAKSPKLRQEAALALDTAARAAQARAVLDQTLAAYDLIAPRAEPQPEPVEDGTTPPHRRAG
jgi:hypothetical protein